MLLRLACLCCSCGLAGSAEAVESDGVLEALAPGSATVVRSGRCADLGAARHWEGLRARLHAGEPVNILAIGSSIVGVHGGCTAPAPVLAQSGCLAQCPKCCGSKCGQWGDGGWARHVFSWINATYPVRSAASPTPGGRGGTKIGVPAAARQHELYNLGEPGGNLIPAMSACPRTYVGFPVHLVLLDLLNANLPSGELASVERLVRALLSMQSRPALLIVEFSKLTVGTAKGQVPLVDWLLALNRTPGVARSLSDNSDVRSLSERSPGVGLSDTPSGDRRSLSGRPPSGTSSLSDTSVAPSLSGAEVVVDTWLHAGDDGTAGSAGSALARKLAARISQLRRMPKATVGSQMEEANEVAGSLKTSSLQRRLSKRYELPHLSVIGCFALPFRARIAANLELRRSTSRAVVAAAAAVVAGVDTAPAPFKLHAYARDGLHPSSAGGRLVGAALISHIQTQLARAQTGAKQAKLPPPLTRQERTVGYACFTFDRAGFDAATNSKEFASIANKKVGKSGVLPKILPTSQGWRFNEVEAGSRTKAKPGMVADTPGSLLEIRLDISKVPGPSIALQYLRSYIGHGTAEASCRGGCVCTRLKINAHTPDQMTSTLEVCRLRLEPVSFDYSASDAASSKQRGADSQGGQWDTDSQRGQGDTDKLPGAGCVLRLAVLNESTSGKFRFKLSRLIVEGQSF